MRYGHKNNLDFLLPENNNYLGNPIHFNTNMVADKYSTTDGQFDLFIHHTRYSQQVKSVMRPGTFYVTILREPTDMFQSLYTFYKFEKKYKDNLTEYIVNNYQKKSTNINYAKRYYNRLGTNQMSWDLGLIPNDFENIAMINEHINMVEKDFDFVMIFEYFDASLVLLAHFMQWPLENVAYLPLNTRNNTYMPILSSDAVRQLRKINKADNMLYSKFLQKFKEKVNEYGIDKLKKGIGELLSINQEILDVCVESQTNKGYAKTLSYKVKENTNIVCKYIAINELKYTSFLRKLQYERLKKYKALDKLMNSN